MAEAWLYDGQSALRYPAQVEAAGSGLRVVWEAGELTVPTARLLHVDTRPDAEIYGHSELGGWRLGLARPVPEDVAAVLPAAVRYGSWIDRLGLGKTVAIGVALSALTIFGAIQIPQVAAPYVPLAWERKMGDAMMAQVDERSCRTPGGEAALKRLAASLSPDAAAIDIEVLDIGVVNAAALPGGRIVIFRQLLAEAKSPDEVAGVLAHEIAHVRERHVTEALIREFGLSIIGGNAGATVTGVMSAGFTRGAEREADSEAARMLGAANISPAPTAAFFKRLAVEEAKFGRVAEGLSYVSTHPMSSERQRFFEGSAQTGRKYRAALTPAEWQALTGICRGRKKAGKAKGE
jgi:Zn-dependent protease with chaperone function